MKTVNNKHNEFVESLRSIMRDKEKNRIEPAKKNEEDRAEDIQSIQEVLEAKYEELFGPIDDDDD